MRRDRLGIALRDHSIEAIYVHRARVIWRDRVSLTETPRIRDELRRLLASAPRARGRLRVVCAVGPRWAQTRRLVGLQIAASRAATVATREHAADFFRRRTPILVANAHLASDGSLWSCAFDGTVIDAVTAALAENGLRLHSAIPEVIAVAERADLARSRGGIADVPVENRSFDAFAAARGATLVRMRCPLAWHPPSSAQQFGRWFRMAIGGAALGAASALFAVLAASSIRGRGFIDSSARCAEIERRAPAVPFHTARSIGSRRACESRTCSSKSLEPEI